MSVDSSSLSIRQLTSGVKRPGEAAAETPPSSGDGKAREPLKPPLESKGEPKASAPFSPQAGEELHREPGDSEGAVAGWVLLKKMFVPPIIGDDPYDSLANLVVGRNVMHKVWAYKENVLKKEEVDVRDLRTCLTRLRISAAVSGMKSELLDQINTWQKAVDAQDGTPRLSPVPPVPDANWQTP